MQIQPVFQSIGMLLQGRLFRIPEYQRAYSWQEKQRGDLFRDIEKVYGSGNDSTHFMATIVGLRRNKKTIAADEYVDVEVVDGQQRLTTLIILLKALAKALKGSGEKYSGEIDSLLVKGDDLSLLLLQTNHDSTHAFIDYLRYGTVPSDKATTAADQNIAAAIAECEEFVKKWNIPGRTLIQLFATIKNRLSVIFHEIEDEALVYTVFEVLNSRGLDVTWFDKLKSLLMAIVFEYGDEGSKKEIATELHSLWTDVYRTIGLHQSLNKETVRFAGTLRLKKSPNRPLAEEQAVQVLVEGCKHQAKAVVDCTKWVLKITKAESRLLADHRLRAATRIVQARLVAIAVLLREFPVSEEKAILRCWENITFRTFGLGRRDARTKVGDYVRLAWSVSNDGLSPQAIIDGLRKIGQEFPIDAAVSKLRMKDCYKGWTEELRYLFFRYEEHLASVAGHALNLSQWNKIWADEPSKSIEHIRPRSKGSEDPSTTGIFVHRLGNLMMLPPGVNSKLQDKEPKDKASSYNSCGLLLAIEVGDAISKGKWDRKAVDAREDRLIQWASEEWKD